MSKLELLNESRKFTTKGQERISSLLESFKHGDTLGVENAEKLVSRADAPDFINESMLEDYLHIASLQDKFLKESNTTADLLTYQKKIQPLLRRILPTTLAMDICSVQPIDNPDGRVFALKANYAGNDTNAITRTSKIFTISSATGTFTLGETVTGGTSTATGVVEYVESGNVVVAVATGTFVTGETITGGTSTETAVIDAIYSTEIAYKKILKGYSGSMATATAEAKTDVNQISVYIESISVQAKERFLKTAFTTELVQDMKAVFGANAEQEIMNYLALEMLLEIDREVIDGYKSLAVTSADLTIASGQEYNVSGKAQFTDLITRINKATNDIAKRNRRGRGNIVVTTSSVITALQELGAFKMFDYGQNVNHGESSARTFVGTLKTGQKVYQDWFAEEDYVLVVYKGTDKMDAGLIYSPYVSMWFDKATNYQTLQPVVGVKTRYALTQQTLIGGEAYAEIFGVDFTGTVLG